LDFDGLLDGGQRGRKHQKNYGTLVSRRTLRFGATVRDIYEKSTQNLFTALDFGESGIEVVRVYDNSEVGGRVKQVLSFRRGRVLSVADEIPGWLESLFKGTKFEIAGLRGR